MTTPELIPFVLGSGPHLSTYAERCPLPGVLALDVFQRSTQPFYRLLNAGNQVAFGGMGMPAWVQLDCCTMPSAMIGFAVPRETLPPHLVDGLLLHVDRVFGRHAMNEARDHGGPVPVSEYCALGTPEAGVFVGFSLFCVMPGHGLGLRTKALALSCYGTTRQLGMTQYNNSAVRTHANLGALRVVHAKAAAHSRPDETFVYELEAPPPGVLHALARGEKAPARRAPEVTHRIRVDSPMDAAAEMEKLLAAGRTVHVVAPGLERVPDGTVMTLRVT